MTFLRIFSIICITQVIGVNSFQGYLQYTCGGAAGQRIPDATTKLMNLSKIDCAFACKNSNGCFSINYNENSMQCELNTIFMPRNMTNCTAATGWRVYDKDLKTGAVAWQSSTMDGLDANRALDGISITLLDATHRSCAHTNGGSSYWAMEFTDASCVGRIVIYFRSDSCCPARSSNLYLLVSQTLDDVMNDIGTLCAFYAGPPADLTAPVTILCDGIVYGKFLKIKSAIGYLTLCEVFVYIH